LRASRLIGRDRAALVVSVAFPTLAVRRRWAQVYAQSCEPLVVICVSLLVKNAEQVLLPRLSEGKAIEGALTLE
jgi:cytochrome c oxidase subunit IV